MALKDAFEQQALANDFTFRARVKFNLANVAFQVLDEDPATVGHSTRAAYARTVITNVDLAVQQVASWLVTRPNLIQSNISLSIVNGVPVVSTDAIDGAFQSQLMSDWSVLAGA